MNNNISNSSLKDRPSRLLLPGFSLIEMLVVITIITIMLSAGAVGLKNLSETGGVTAAVPTAESIFSQAREIAVGRGATARVLISADQDDHDKYLRYMLVAYLWEDENGDSKWIASSRGVSLPKGVYFSQKYSFENHSTSTGTISEDNMELFANIDSSSPNSNLSSSYFYYEFNAEGNMVTPAASYVVNSGKKAPGQKNPRLSSRSVSGFGGFVIWKKGTTSAFRHPDQIGVSGAASAGSEF